MGNAEGCCQDHGSDHRKEALPNRDECKDRFSPRGQGSIDYNSFIARNPVSANKHQSNKFGSALHSPTAQSEIVTDCTNRGDNIQLGQMLEADSIMYSPGGFKKESRFSERNQKISDIDNQYHFTPMQSPSVGHDASRYKKRTLDLMVNDISYVRGCS